MFSPHMWVQLNHFQKYYSQETGTQVHLNKVEYDGGHARAAEPD